MLQTDWEDVDAEAEAEASGCPGGGDDDAQYRCDGDGRCIPLRWLCDYHADCLDGDDEQQECRELGIKQTNKQTNKQAHLFCSRPVARFHLTKVQVAV